MRIQGIDSEGILKVILVFQHIHVQKQHAVDIQKWSERGCEMRNESRVAWCTLMIKELHEAMKMNATMRMSDIIKELLEAKDVQKQHAVDIQKW